MTSYVMFLYGEKKLNIRVVIVFKKKSRITNINGVHTVGVSIV